MNDRLEIILPTGMLGGHAADDFLGMALSVIGVGFGEEGGWNAKYGADFENDVFMMKRFCWCGREGICPWCTGCVVYEETCRACKVAGAHSDTCFQIELSRREAKYDKESGYNAIGAALRGPDMMERGEKSDGYGSIFGSRRSAAGDALHKEWCMAHDARTKAHDQLKSALYRERGLQPEAYAWLCDCGANEAGKKLRATQGCDYNKGSGIFARFAPWTLDHERHYYDPPNFWFKPSNLRVSWYKYIGRDMTTNKDDVIPDFLERVFATHPRGMTLAEAIAETERQEKATADSFADMFSRHGISAGIPNRG